MVYIINRRRKKKCYKKAEEARHHPGKEGTVMRIYSI